MILSQPQLVEDFQQRAVAAGSEDAASVATLQKCEELLPGEVIIVIKSSNQSKIFIVIHHSIISYFNGIIKTIISNHCR